MVHAHRSCQHRSQVSRWAAASLVLGQTLLEVAE